VADTLDAIDEMDLTCFGDWEDQEALRSVLRESLDVFSPKTGTVPGWEFRIKAEYGAELAKLNRPVMLRSPTEQEVERWEMQGLMERGIVEPSESPYGTANVFLPKKALPDGTSGGLRVTADMRAVKSVTIGDAFPGEDIQTIVNWFAGKKWFSAADFRDGYWNVGLAKESRAYAAVKTVIGLVQYTRTTMGQTDASAFFQRLVNHVHEELKGTKLQAYLDDLAVGSDTPKQHIADVREMLERARQGNLRLKLAKCSFEKKEVELLGHKVAHRRVEPNYQHRDCLHNFREPVNASCCGSWDYCSFSVVTSTGWWRWLCLYTMNYKSQVGTDRRRRRKAFGYMTRTTMGGTKEGGLPAAAGCVSGSIIPGTGATDGKKVPLHGCQSVWIGCGAAPVRRRRQGVVPVGFATRKIKGAEPPYTTTEKESLAVVFGLRKFQHLLHGEDFEVVTDHTALTWLCRYGNPRSGSRDGSWRFKPSDSRCFTRRETENLWRCQTQ
jgi:Reverse transcriptase (RNA-dependent DNA polymerase)/RNase H-like domain found in reverse transcriptase